MTFLPGVLSSTETFGLFSIVTFLEFGDFDVIGTVGAGAFLGLAFFIFLVVTDDEGLEDVLEVDAGEVVDCNFLGDFEAFAEEFSID